MAKTQRVTVDILSEEEFDKIPSDVIEEHMERLELAENFDEFIALLEEIGIRVTKEEVDDECAGPNDTIH